MSEGEEVETETSQSSCPAYDKLLEGRPPVEEMIASYFSVGETSSLKAPSFAI